MRLSVINIIFYLSILSGLKAQQFDLSNRFRQHVQSLSAIELGGRFSGTEEESKAKEYIVSHLLLGKKTRLSIDSFTIDTVILGHKIKTQTSNIQVFLNNKADSTIILIAHFDHLGIDSIGLSNFSGNPTLHPGADDNASGVAFLLELEKEKEIKKAKCNYLFLFTSGEEIGLLGAKHFLHSIYFNRLKVKLVLNFDMVGRCSDETKFMAYCTSGWTKPRKQELLNLDNEKLLTFSEACPKISDHYPFYQNGIKTIFLTSGIHKDYHRPSDTFEKLNYEKMSGLFELIKAFVTK